MPELTDEHIEDLFADLRAGEVARIRPPGVAAARHTVRRRRAATSVAAAVTVIAVAGGIAATASRPEHAYSSPSSAPLQDQELGVLATTARLATLADSPAKNAFADHGVVDSAYRSIRPTYHGELTLRAACAGTGTVTLVVRGSTGSEGDNAVVRLAEMALSCQPDPAVHSRTFLAENYANIIVELSDTEGARHRAGFAYRVTSDTGDPVENGTGRDNPTAALDLPTKIPAGSFGGSGSLTTSSEQRMSDWHTMNGRYELLVACTGLGIMQLKVEVATEKKNPASSVVNTIPATVACSYPAKRRRISLGTFQNREVRMSYSYQSTSPASGRIAYQFMPY